MCGRFSLAAALDQIFMRFDVPAASIEYSPRYNIAPGQPVFAILAHEGKRRMGQLRWGLIPSWAKEEKMGHKLINCQAETVHQKPAFSSSFRRKRCIIPADGFFEWQQTATGKQPMRITLKSGQLFSMAAVYDTWTAPDGRKVSTCSILTTQPNELVAPIHRRMPVILHPEDETLWLDRELQDPGRLQPLLQPYPATEMLVYPVSALVGNVKNDLPECIRNL